MAEAADVEELLQRAAAGESAAAAQLLARHRPRLKRMLRVRMDDRLAGRVDDSDLVQEALADAAERLPRYLAERPVAFYPWLRALAEERLADALRHHGAAKRAVGREQAGGLPDHSAVELAGRIACPGSSPSQAFAKRELREKALAALGDVDPDDREVLVLYYLEELTIPEVAAVLGIAEEAARSRRRRALVKLGTLLEGLRKEFGG